MSSRSKIQHIIARINADKARDTNLYLVYNNMGKDGCREIAKALEKSRHIKRVDLGRNQLSANDARFLAEMLAVNHSIERLDLSTNDIGDAGVRDFAEALVKNDRLEILNLNDNHIGDEGAIAIAAMLKKNSHLTQLSLSNNTLSPIGAAALANALETNTTLIQINLSKNDIDDEGAKLLARSLRENKSLAKLDLSRNNITSLGANNLANLLEYNNTIKELDLMNNKINDVGAKYLAQMITHSKTLLRIDLNQNEITDDGATMIMRALDRNKIITQVDLRGNPMKPEMIDAIAQMATKNLELKKQFERAKEAIEAIKRLANSENSRLKNSLNILYDMTHLVNQNYPGALNLLDDLNFIVGMNQANKLDVPFSWALLQPLLARKNDAYNVLANLHMNCLFEEQLQIFPTVQDHCHFIFLLLTEGAQNNRAEAITRIALMKLYYQGPLTNYTMSLLNAKTVRELIHIDRVIPQKEFVAIIDNAIQSLWNKDEKQSDNQTIKLLKQVKKNLLNFTPSQFLTLCEHKVLKPLLIKEYGTTALATYEHLITHPQGFPVEIDKNKQLDEILDHLDTPGIQVKRFENHKKNLFNLFHEKYDAAIAAAIRFHKIIDSIYSAAENLDMSIRSDIEFIYLQRTQPQEKTSELIDMLLYIIDKKRVMGATARLIINCLGKSFDSYDVHNDSVDLHKLRRTIAHEKTILMPDGGITNWQLKRAEADIQSKKEKNPFSTLNIFNMHGYKNAVQLIQKMHDCRSAFERYRLYKDYLEKNDDPVIRALFDDDSSYNDQSAATAS